MQGTITPAERRSAHARVGVAAVAAFVALLLVLAATHRPASADPAVPAAAPTAEPQQTVPEDPGFRPRREGGFGRRGGGGGPGFGGGGGGGGEPGGGGDVVPAPQTPAPDTGGNTT